jgi:hypothetical protein
MKRIILVAAALALVLVVVPAVEAKGAVAATGASRAGPPPQGAGPPPKGRAHRPKARAHRPRGRAHARPHACPKARAHSPRRHHRPRAGAHAGFGRRVGGGGAAGAFADGYYYSGDDAPAWGKTEWSTEYNRIIYWDPYFQTWYYWDPATGRYYPVSCLSSSGEAEE